MQHENNNQLREKGIGAKAQQARRNGFGALFALLL